MRAALEKVAETIPWTPRGRISLRPLSVTSHSHVAPLRDLHNAVKYSPDGGAITVTVSAHPDQQRAHLALRDHGIGNPAEERAKLFGRFARADNARERGIEGTGLELFLCRELVERHGGQICFESNQGQGSTFFVTLPLAAVDPADDDIPEVP